MLNLALSPPPLDMTRCLSYSFKVTLRVQQAHGAERLLHGWWSLNAQCSIYSVLGGLHVWSLLLSHFLFGFPRSSFSLMLGLWVWSRPGTQPLSPQAPSFIHRIRLSSERIKSSTAHIFDAKHVGLRKILRRVLETSR